MQLVFDLPKEMSGFNSKASHVGCVGDKGVLGQVYLQALWFFLTFRIIPSLFHSHLSIADGVAK